MAELSPRQDAWLQSQRLHDTFDGYSADEIESMSMDEFARLTGREFNVKPKAPAPQPAPAGQDPAAVAAAQPPTPETPDFASMSFEDYAQLRGQLGVGVGQKEGRGIFDSVGSRSRVYLDAVRAQSGRTALNNANVVEPPRLEGRYLDPDARLDTRSVADRFGTPGNSWQGR